jgi:hypothetical protein
MSAHRIQETFPEIDCGANGAPCGVFTRTPHDMPLVCDGGREYVGGGAQNRAVNVL